MTKEICFGTVCFWLCAIFMMYNLGEENERNDRMLSNTHHLSEFRDITWMFNHPERDLTYQDGNFHGQAGEVVDGPFCNSEDYCAIEVRLKGEGACHTMGDVVTAFYQKSWPKVSIGVEVFLFSDGDNTCESPRAVHWMQIPEVPTSITTTCLG